MATKDTNYLVAVHKGLDESLEKQVAALPEKFNKQRFLQNCMTVLQDGQADFSKCEAPTVVRTLLKGAFLGLDFFNGECYAIPYGNQCQFQTDYKGEIKLCKRYSSNPIQDIYAKVVREGDKFEEVIENGKQYVNFRPKTFSNGEIIGAFAVVLYKDGSMMYDTMSKEDIEHTRQTFILYLMENFMMKLEKVFIHMVKKLRFCLNRISLMELWIFLHIFRIQLKNMRIVFSINIT